MDVSDQDHEPVEKTLDAALSGPDSGHAREPAVLDRDGLFELVGDYPDLLVELVGIFQKECPGQVEQIRSAVQEGDAPSLRIAAHTLKGSAANLKGEAVAQVASRLEDMGEFGQLAEAIPAVNRLENELVLLNTALNELLQSMGQV